jgi:hypothetical protein
LLLRLLFVFATIASSAATFLSRMLVFLSSVWSTRLIPASATETSRLRPLDRSSTDSFVATGFSNLTCGRPPGPAWVIGAPWTPAT